MSDNEREARIRQQLDGLRGASWKDQHYLLRRLDAARLALSDRDRLREEVERHRARAERFKEDRDYLDAEIARLRALPGADVMELAARAYGFVAMPDPVTLFPRQMEIIEGVARALSQHGSSEYARAIEDAAQQCTTDLNGEMTRQRILALSSQPASGDAVYRR